MKQIVVFIILFGLLGSGLVAQNNLTERFVKPMKLKASVSGSFGELRSNHFHSGLDLSTNRKTGYSVYASDKGYVSRIKVSPFGYGKALYVDHDGGYTTVYAHLERYAHRIDSLVRAKQYEKKSFAVELFFKAGELEVERGELIAYSGNSGSSGGPHLHYEVRDQVSQKPMNPLAFRDDIRDDVRPRIQGLKLYVLSGESSVEGRREHKYVPAVFYDRAFHPKGSTSFSACGKIGVGVQVLDYLSDSWRKCGISTIDLYSNDTLVYNFHIDKFSFAESRYINSHIDYAEKKRTGKVIQKGFVEPNNRLSLYGKKNEYTVNLKEGDIKIIRYVIKDFAGNKSVLVFTLKGEKPLPQLLAEKRACVKVRYDKPVQLDTLGMKLDIPAKTFYTNIEMLIRKEEKSGLIAPLYIIGDSHIPLHRSMSISIPVPDALAAHKNKIVIADISSAGQQHAVGGEYKNGHITVLTRSFGRFSLAIDSVPPIVKLNNAPVNNKYSMQQSINIRISDKLSGIKTYACFINDQWVLFEYDAKKALLTGTFKNMPFLKKGNHRLTVNVLDNKGNKMQKKFSFSLN